MAGGASTNASRFGLHGSEYVVEKPDLPDAGSLQFSLSDIEIWRILGVPQSVPDIEGSLQIPPTRFVELDVAGSQRGNNGGGELHALLEIHFGRDSSDFAILSEDMRPLTENRPLRVRERVIPDAQQVALKHPEDAFDGGT
jgi:hypothetical protein